MFTPNTRGDEKNVLTNPNDNVRAKTTRLNVVAIGVKCAGNRCSSSQRMVLMLRRSIRDTVVSKKMVLSFDRLV